MKTKSIALVVVLLVALTDVGTAADNPNEALQKGLLEEEANHNLDAAIQAYQSVVNQFDDQRKIAATAVFRLAECYRKQGKTNEAVAQYQRLVQDFSDQESLVGPSERNLAALGRATTPGVAEASNPIAPTVRDPEQLDLLKKEIDLVQQEIKTEDAKFRVGRGGFADIVRSRKELLALQRRLPENASSGSQTNLVGQQIQLGQQLLNEVKKQIEVGAAAPGDETPLKRELLGLQRELIAVAKVSSTARLPADGASAAASDEEAKEIQRLKETIKNSPDLINARSTGERTPLHNAASKGQLEVARFLLDNKAQVTAKDNSGSTPLHVAANNGHKAMVELLLGRGADVNARDNLQQTPLHLAASEGYQAVAEALLAHGADVNARYYRGSTPLHGAAVNDRAGMVLFLLENKADIDAKDNEGTTPLNHAVKYGKSDLAKLLVEKGANVDIPGTWGDTPLHSTIVKFSDELFKAILSRKPDLELKNGDDMTPLQTAVYRGNARAVELLLKAGANPNVRFDWKEKFIKDDRTQPYVVNFIPQGATLSGEGRTPLHLAVELDNKGIVEALLANGADVNAKDDYGATPLHRAIWPGRKSILETLLTHKADVNARDKTDNTPLHDAVLYGDKSIVELLLARGADVNARNKEGKTPLDLTKSSFPPGGPPLSPVRRAGGTYASVPTGIPGAPGLVPGGIPDAQAQKPASPAEIADLLRQHGAKE